MDKTYIIVAGVGRDFVQEKVDYHLANGGELVGGVSAQGDMLVQAMLVPVEEETEHEDENIHS